MNREGSSVYLRSLDDSSIFIAQSWVKYGPWAKSGPPAYFVYKVLLECSYIFIYLYTVYACFWTIHWEDVTKTIWDLQSLKYLLLSLLRRILLTLSLEDYKLKAIFVCKLLNLISKTRKFSGYFLHVPS